MKNNFLKNKPIFGKFIKSTDGASAVEFAFVAPLFLSFVFAIIGHSIVSLQITYLDYATEEAASRIKVENVTSADINIFKEEVFCPAASILLDCDKIEIGMLSHPDYTRIQIWRTTNDTLGTFCYGTAGDIVLLHARYEISDIFKPLMFGLPNVATEDELYTNSKYFIAREPTVTNERNC